MWRVVFGVLEEVAVEVEEDESEPDMPADEFRTV
jgi:hypothetical protein